MSIAKIQKGDQVVVTTGAFKGHKGVVTKVINLTRPNGKPQTKVSVSELKQLVDYQKANSQYGIPGQKGLKDRLIDSSNVSLVDEKGKVSKVKVELDSKGKKSRVYKTTGKPVTKQKVQIDKTKLDTKETK